MTTLLDDLNKTKAALLVLAAITKFRSPMAAEYVEQAATKISAAIQQIKVEQRPTAAQKE